MAFVYTTENKLSALGVSSVDNGRLQHLTALLGVELGPKVWLLPASQQETIIRAYKQDAHQEMPPTTQRAIVDLGRRATELVAQTVENPPEPDRPGAVRRLGSALAYLPGLVNDAINAGFRAPDRPLDPSVADLSA